jgi:hypothetical protein
VSAGAGGLGELSGDRGQAGTAGVLAVAGGGGDGSMLGDVAGVLLASVSVIVAAAVSV